MPLTIEQLKLAFNTFKSFRVNASQTLFNKVLGEDISEHYWFKFSQTYHCDIIGFWGYLDEAYKEVLLNYLLSTVVPKLEKASQ